MVPKGEFVKILNSKTATTPVPGSFLMLQIVIKGGIYQYCIHYQ
jgi:hypothetical protein